MSEAQVARSARARYGWRASVRAVQVAASVSIMASRKDRWHRSRCPRISERCVSRLPCGDSERLSRLGSQSGAMGRPAGGRMAAMCMYAQAPPLSNGQYEIPESLVQHPRDIRDQNLPALARRQRRRCRSATCLGDRREEQRIQHRPAAHMATAESGVVGIRWISGAGRWSAGGVYSPGTNVAVTSDRADVLMSDS